MSIELTAEEIGLKPQPVSVEQTKDVEATEPTFSEPKQRGRPKGSGAKSTTSKPTKTQAKKDADAASLAKQIQGIHVMLSMFLQMPELAISDSESQMLAKSLNTVAEEYGLSLDGKTGATIQLLGAAAIIYVPRALAVIQRQKATISEHAVN